MKALSRMDPRVKLLCLAAYFVAALHARSAAALGACLAVAVGLALAVRLDARTIARVAKPLVPIVVITVIAQVLYTQQGTVLARIGPLALTADALVESARMIACLLCLVLASVSFMRCTGTEDLLQTIDWCLRPLRRLRVRTDGFSFALSVAFRFVPVLSAEFQQVKRAHEARLVRFEGGVRTRLGAYMRLFAPLVRNTFRHADALAASSVSRCLGHAPARTSLHPPAGLGVPEALCVAAAVALLAVAFAA